MKFKIQTFAKKEYLIYFFFSFCFIALNFATLSSLLPWCDEVMFMDTPVNYIKYGSWSTTAWYGADDVSAFSLYPPLFQWCEVCWFKIWGGVSLYSARSLNFILILLIGFLMLSFTRKELLNNQSLNSLSVILFTILLWGTKEFGWMYRNGRPDILGLLFCLLTLRSTWNYIKYNRRIAKLLSSVYAGLALMSGIQTAVFLIAFILFTILFFKEKRKQIYKVAIFVLGGITIGMLICIAFFLNMGYLKPFIGNIVSMSATMKQLFELIRPYLEGPLHLKPAAEHEITNVAGDSPSFLSRLSDSFEYISYIILLSVNIVILFVRRKEITCSWIRNNVIVLTIFSLFIIVFMNLAGRFAIYYRWMIYLPIVLSVLIVLNQERKFRKTEYTLYSITTIILMALGIHSFNTDTGLNKKVDDIDMNEFHHLMKSANIPQDSHIAGPFFSFYELKNNYTHCYFPQVYPTKFIKKLDYLVVYGENRYKKGFPLYGQASVINDLRELQNRNDVKLELVKEDKKNDIQLYHIH